MSQINLFSLSLFFFSASDGPVFQSDGKNRQGEEDVVSDTVYVTGHYRPEIGERVVVMIVLFICSSGSRRNLPTGVYFIEHSDLLKSDSGYSCHILVN